MPNTYSTQSLTDWLKPRKGEAIIRLRNNVFGLVVVLITTYLLPLPSPWIAFHVMSTKAEVGAVWWSLCAIELLILTVLGTNILQASYALQYPPPAHPQLAAGTPAKPKPTPKSPTGPPRRFKGLTSPTTSPQPQKSFGSSYAASPISTPSRTLNYTIPPSASSAFDSSLNSSISLPGSPSPILSSPLAAYRGKNSASIGRAFDGDFLARMTEYDSDED